MGRQEGYVSPPRPRPSPMDQSREQGQDDSSPLANSEGKAKGGGNADGGWCWPRVHHAAITRADEIFYALGLWVARRPYQTLTIGLCCVVLCSFGFANFTVETDGEELWAPEDSLSYDQEETILEYFQKGVDYAVVQLEHPEDGGSVLTKDSMDTFWSMHSDVVALETEAGNSFAELCSKTYNGANCSQPLRGVGRFWGNSFDTYTASVSSDADVLAAVNVDEYPDGSTVSHAAVFGNSLTYGTDGSITGAKAMMQSYEVELMYGDDRQCEEVQEWLAQVQDLMAVLAAGEVTLDVVYFTGRSIDDALAESVSGEVYLFVATYAIMVVFVMICVGRCSRGPVERRSWLGLAGVSVVVAAGLAAYGINSAFGVPFTPLSPIFPFILVGIGVDDMFVILASFDHTDPTLPVEERMALGMKRCGVSITYTSLTSFCAFMLGSMTSLPAVEYFCLYAATAVLFDLFLQVTVFAALVTMDAKRQAAGRLDWCCCRTNQTYLEERMERGVDLHQDESQRMEAMVVRTYGRTGSTDEVHAQVNPMSELSEAAASRAAKQSGGVVLDSETSAGGVALAGEEVHALPRAGRWMRDTYAPCLLSPAGEALVLLGSALLLAAGVYGTTRVTQGFDVLDLAPDGHFARDYAQASRVYELEHDSQPLPLGVYVQAVDYTNTTVQAIIQAANTIMAGQEFMSGPVDSWLTSFGEWAVASDTYRGNTGSLSGYHVYEDNATFYQALGAFTVDGENTRFLSAIVLDTDGRIVMSKSEMYLVNLTSTGNAIDCMEDVRRVSGIVPLEHGIFGYCPAFLFFEQYLIIYDELSTNSILALAAVAALSLLVLGRASIVVVVCATVVMVDVELLGFVHHWGLEVNSITVIELIVVVGLVADYVFHVVHYFLRQDAGIDKNARIATALGEIGPSVVIGAAMTFLGIMPLAFASNVIFRDIFKMFFVIIGFGSFHGLVLIPVVLSVMPASWCCHKRAMSDADLRARTQTSQTIRNASGRPDEFYPEDDAGGAGLAPSSSEGSPRMVMSSRPSPVDIKKESNPDEVVTSSSVPAASAAFQARAAAAASVVVQGATTDVDELSEVSDSASSSMTASTLKGLHLVAGSARSLSFRTVASVPAQAPAELGALAEPETPAHPDTPPPPAPAPTPFEAPETKTHTESTQPEPEGVRAGAEFTPQQVAEPKPVREWRHIIASPGGSGGVAYAYGATGDSERKYTEEWTSTLSTTSVRSPLAFKQRSIGNAHNDERTPRPHAPALALASPRPRSAMRAEGKPGRESPRRPSSTGNGGSLSFKPTAATGPKMWPSPRKTRVRGENTPEAGAGPQMWPSPARQRGYRETTRIVRPVSSGRPVSAGRPVFTARPERKASPVGAGPKMWKEPRRRPSQG